MRTLNYYWEKSIQPHRSAQREPRIYYVHINLVISLNKSSQMQEKLIVRAKNWLMKQIK